MTNKAVGLQQETLEVLKKQVMEHHRIVNDTNVDIKERLEERELMYRTLHGMWGLLDLEEYDNLYETIHNNIIDNNFTEYFTLAA